MKDTPEALHVLVSITASSVARHRPEHVHIEAHSATDALPEARERQQSQVFDSVRQDLQHSFLNALDLAFREGQWYTIILLCIAFSLVATGRIFTHYLSPSILSQAQREGLAGEECICQESTKEVIQLKLIFIVCIWIYHVVISYCL